MSTWEEMKDNYPILRGKQEKDFKQHRNGGWVERTAKVTRSIIRDDSLVLGKATVDMCELKGQSIIKDNAKVTLSSLDYVSTIGGNAVADRCTLFGSAILDNAVVNVSALRGYSVVRDNAIVYNSTLEGKCLVVGSTALSTCYVHNSTVNILNRAFLTEFINGSFTDIPLTINDQLIGYDINVYKEKVAVGCTQQSINWWKKNAKKMREENFNSTKEENVNKLIEAITTLQEVYNDNMGRDEA